MENMIFSDNLRRLRLEKGLTQEQLAQQLGVSAQSVSRWECGTTLPDVMLLPRIAGVYGVTVDDLYREAVKAYPSYAQRLLAVYEASGRTADFLAAEEEFLRMAEPSADDLRAWGVLYHYMMKQCADLAQSKLEQAMVRADRSDRVWRSAAQQKTALMCDLGRGMEEAARYDRELMLNPADAQRWLLCCAAHYFSGSYLRAREIAREAISRFPDNAALHLYAGDSCRALKEYEEAFTYWQRAKELDGTYLDAAYSMGFCYEELGQYDAAYRVWQDLAKELERRGLTEERKYPTEMAENCRRKMEHQERS